MRARHAKYVPPVPLPAPPDLAALVAAHLACPPGGEWGRTLTAIQTWGAVNRVRMYQTFHFDGHYISLSDSLPQICRRGTSNNQEERWR